MTLEELIQEIKAGRFDTSYSKITPTPKEKSKEEILEELKKKYPKELFDKYDYIQGM